MKRNLLLLCCIFIYILGYTQENPPSDSEELRKQVEANSEAIKNLQRLKISGYIQTQFEYGEKDASLKVGSSNQDPSSSYSRIGIRRGRVKLTYEENYLQAVFQINITEKKIGVKDVYLSLKSPWSGKNSLRVGIFNRPFGYEIGYSSSRRETPERATIFQTLFPDERDLGVMLSLQASEDSAWNFLKLQAGLFAGNGIQSETDSKKDFIGQLLVNKNLSEKIKLGMGASYYNGSVYQGTENVYRMQGHTFVLDNKASNKGGFAKREYFGVDLQLRLDNPIGNTEVRGEYLFGTQPGARTNSKSPNASSPLEIDTYIRNFKGGYLSLIQDIDASGFAAVLKYDWYDPNTKVSGNNIGKNYTNKGDIAYQSFGFGMLWNIKNNLRLQAYYNIVSNETTSLSGYEKDLKDNHFALRLQLIF